MNEDDSLRKVVYAAQYEGHGPGRSHMATVKSWGDCSICLALGALYRQHPEWAPIAHPSTVTVYAGENVTQGGTGGQVDLADVADPPVPLED